MAVAVAVAACRRRALALLWACGLALGPVGAWAQTDAATAELLMQRSGLWSQLASVAPQMREGLLQDLQRSGHSNTASEAQRLQQVFDAAYAPQRLRSVAAETVRLSLRADAVAALLAWYEGALGRRIVGLEAAAAADRDQPALVQHGQALLQAMAPQRQALLDQVVRLSQAVDAAVQINTDTSLGVQRGLRSVRPDAPGQMSEAELRQHLQAGQAQLRSAFGALVRASLASTYQALTDAELQAYLAFMASAPGQHYLTVAVSAVGAALVQASTALGRGLPGIKDQANT